MYTYFQRTIFLIVCALLVMVHSDGGKSCEVQTRCTACHQDEMQTDYCQKTGKKILYRCSADNVEYNDYRSCDLTDKDEQLQVIVFQVVMAIVGGLAYWGVQSRKKNTMTLFDYRKQRY